MRLQMLTFLPGKSLFHRMTPPAKLAWAGGLTILSMALHSVTAQLLLIVLTLISALWLARVRAGSLASISSIFFMLAATLFVVQSLTASGTTPLFKVFGVVVTKEAVTLAATVALRMALFVLIALVFVTTTDPSDLADSLTEQMSVPRGFALMLFMLLRMAEVFERELEGLRDSYRLRYYGRALSLRQHFINLTWPVVALLIRGLRRSQTMSISMMVRGVDQVPATRLRGRLLTMTDAAFLATFYLAVAASLYLFRHFV
jgi:energy-coupling factor transport system permease protein